MQQGASKSFAMPVSGSEEAGDLESDHPRSSDNNYSHWIGNGKQLFKVHDGLCYLFFKIRYQFVSE